MENKEIQENTEPQKDKKVVKCPSCNYIWETSSEKRYVSCPDCLNKVKIEDNLK